MAEMLTPKQAAEKLGVSTMTLAGWRKQGKYLNYYKIGKKISYSSDDVQAMLDRAWHKVEAD